MQRVTLACVGLVLCAVIPPLGAQSVPGKVDKYHLLEGLSVPKDTYPALTIEDLRKITLYSKLSIGQTRGGVIAVIDDDTYMRSIEPRNSRDLRRTEVRTVTSDHFRFTTLKDGTFNPKALPTHLRTSYRFLWIKHATRESPDGAPWLKDMLLIPYTPKTGKLLCDWPFSMDPRLEKALERARAGKVDVSPQVFRSCFLKVGDPRADQLQLPSERESVVGTFQVGARAFLVLDVFGCYSWWGMVTSTEFYPLRGQSNDVIKRFHDAPTSRRATRRYASRMWASRGGRSLNRAEVFAATSKDVERIIKGLPDVLTLKVKSESPKGWKDALRLEEEGMKLPLIDVDIQHLQTFGDLLSWARDYAQQRSGSSSIYDWALPLEKLLTTNGRGHVTTARALRYAFRTMGFPCVLQGMPRAGRAEFPNLALHIMVPSKGISWVVYSWGSRDAVLEITNPELNMIPISELPLTQRRPLPVFDIHMGGLYSPGRPVP